jgi:predicted Fe-Mo cluster-binding NifX family protein
MIIGISAFEKDITKPLAPRLGRCRNFLIYNLATETYTWQDNINSMDAPQGAGIQAAQNLIDQEVSAVITGHCGPKAFTVLNSAKIVVYTAAEISCADAVEAFQQNRLEKMEQADVEGHWV